MEENNEPLNLNEFDNHENEPKEELSTPLTILSFCIPIAGAVMFFMYKSNEPQKSKRACYAALGGMVFGIVVRVILTVAGAY